MGESVTTRLEGEFRAMRLILRALGEHIGNVTPEGRRWLRVKIAEIMGGEES